MKEQKRIDELKQELSKTKGTECDVYSRVVGYHSPVKNWNNGKKEEFEQRETFKVAK